MKYIFAFTEIYFKINWFHQLSTVFTAQNCFCNMLERNNDFLFLAFFVYTQIHQKFPDIQ